MHAALDRVGGKQPRIDTYQFTQPWVNVLSWQYDRRTKQRTPERWSRATRNWMPVGEAWLNPENQDSKDTGTKDEAA